MALRLLYSIAALLLILASSSFGAKSRKPKHDQDWWKKTVVYQIYPRSFKDSDGDGVGDLKGIQSCLGHFEYLGVETIWLSPVYKSPFKDFGYDISDHKDIDPVFGTLQDMDDLIEDIHSRGMYLIMDFIPNHTSDLHPWFVESRKGGEDNPYSDWYIWSDGKVLEDGTRAPPNNWLSIFHGSAWQWDEGRQQYYYHQFIPEQPDLDFRNPAVREAMEDVLRFWSERRVDGFRVDAIQTLFEVEDLTLDEPRSLQKGVKPFEHSYLLHPYTISLQDIHEVTMSWRTKVFDPIDAKTGKHTYMVMEVYSPDDPEASMKYYHSGADMPFNFNYIFVNKTCGGTCFKALTDAWMDNMPEDKWPSFVLGNHDNKRISTRKGAEYTNALNILLLTLPGTPTTYYGEEIGMLDIDVSYEDTQDPAGFAAGPELYRKYSRDPARAPMQWNTTKNAGFSTAEKTWLPVHPGYKLINVLKQMMDKESVTPLQIFRQAVRVRKQPSFQNNKLQYHVVNEQSLSFLRSAEGHDTFLVALNVGDDHTTEDLRVGEYNTGLVEVHTGNFDHRIFKMDEGTTIDLSNVPLAPGQGFVVKLQQTKDEL